MTVAPFKILSVLVQAGLGFLISRTEAGGTYTRLHGNHAVENGEGDEKQKVNELGHEMFLLINCVSADPKATAVKRLLRRCIRNIQNQGTRKKRNVALQKCWASK